MSELWRLLDLGVTEPYDNWINRETLLVAIKRNLIPNTVCFQIPSRHVWVGKQANLEKRVNLEYCSEERIPVVRGPVTNSVLVYDEDVLDCTAFSRRPPYDNLINSQIKGLQFMGLEAELKPGSNDIVVNGKKVSGACHLPPLGASGSVTVDFNYDFCEKAIIQIPNKNMKPGEGVTTLKAELGRDVSFSEVISALRKGFESVLQAEFEVSKSLTEAEEQIFEGLQEKYRSEEWLKYGRWSPVKDYGR